MSGHGHPHAQSTPETALDALLAAERGAATRLNRARAEAAEIVESAQAKVAALMAHAEETRTRELARLVEAHRVALADIERAVAQSTADALQRYQGLDDAVVTRLAAVVLSDITGLTAGAP